MVDNLFNYLSKLKRRWKYILGVSVLVFIISGGVLEYCYRKGIFPLSAENDIQESIFPEAIWREYVNSQSGFSMRIPKAVDGLYRCPLDQTFQVPVKVFEDNENGIVYISQEYFYEAQWDSELEKFTGPCEKITRSPELLGNEYEQTKSFLEWPMSFKPFLGWAIFIRDVKDENELNKFIKENYASGCFVGDKISWRQEGSYEVIIRGEDWGEEGTSLGTTTCPWSYIYKLLYFPEKNKIISVNLGQECTFRADVYANQCYDEEIVSSLRF